MHRTAIPPLGLLALLTTACPPAAPPPVDPSDEPAGTDPTPVEPTTDPAEPGEPPAVAQGDPAPPTEPPPAEPVSATESTGSPPATAGREAEAARLLAAADCFPRAVDALQAEPREGESLEAFLARGLERLRTAGPLPGACGTLRPDGPAVPICPHGNPVRVTRTEGSRDTYDDGHEELQLVYRLDCGGGVTATTELIWSVGGD